MSFSEAFSRLDGAAKLTLFDFSVDPGKTYTLWAGLIGGSLLSLGDDRDRRGLAAQTDRTVRVRALASCLANSIS